MRSKHQSSWNKGLAESEEKRAAKSRRMAGRIPWNKGKPWSEETKAKMRKPKTKKVKPPLTEEELRDRRAAHNERNRQYRERKKLKQLNTV